MRLPEKVFSDTPFTSICIAAAMSFVAYGASATGRAASGGKARAVFFSLRAGLLQKYT